MSRVGRDGGRARTAVERATSSPKWSPGPSVATLRPLRLTVAEPSTIDEGLVAGVALLDEHPPPRRSTSSEALAIFCRSRFEHAEKSGTCGEVVRWELGPAMGRSIARPRGVPIVTAAHERRRPTSGSLGLMRRQVRAMSASIRRGRRSRCSGVPDSCPPGLGPPTVAADVGRAAPLMRRQRAPARSICRFPAGSGVFTAGRLSARRLIATGRNIRSRITTAKHDRNIDFLRCRTMDVVLRALAARTGTPVRARRAGRPLRLLLVETGAEPPVRERLPRGLDPGAGRRGRRPAPHRGLVRRRSGHRCRTSPSSTPTACCATRAAGCRCRRSRPA